MEIRRRQRRLADHRERRRRRPARPELRGQQGRGAAAGYDHHYRRRQDRNHLRRPERVRHARNRRIEKQLPDSRRRRTDRRIRSAVDRRRLDLRNQRLPVAASRTAGRQSHDDARPQRGDRGPRNDLRADCRRGGGKSRL